MKQEFKIGDNVVALTEPESSKNQTRKIGKKYIVRDIMYCSRCGEQSINIGVSSNFKYVKCDCGEIQDNKGKSWTLSSCFIKIDTIENEMYNAVKKEDYEQAAFFRDIIKLMNTECESQ